MKISGLLLYVGEIHCVQQEADNVEDHFAMAIQVWLKVLTKFSQCH